ncbi:MAG: hypothetical protein IPL09_00065 [Bacteroidetes bacterium]|nr:hypothetical protein [Bacteroidota bacterium]
MEHKHTYDAKGKQLCCSQQEKIYTNAGASSLLEDGHCKKMGTIIVNIQTKMDTTIQKAMIV